MKLVLESANKDGVNNIMPAGCYDVFLVERNEHNHTPSNGD